MTAEPLKECPKCSGALKRIIGTGAGPIFKGSGFYQTDYKNQRNGKVNNSKPSADRKKSTIEKKAD
jgi:predicted nucleic acid-binding Zn ribbon protein